MKNNWKEEFRKEFIGEGYTHPGMESFIESLLAEQKRELMDYLQSLDRDVRLDDICKKVQDFSTK